MITLLSCPGDTIKEHLEHIKMSPEELAGKLGMPLTHITGLLEGKFCLTKLIAHALEAILGPPAIFWLNLEENYKKQDLEGFINNVCLSYRHDYGLLTPEEQKAVRFGLGEWLHAMSNNLPIGHSLRNIFQQLEDRI